MESKLVNASPGSQPAVQFYLAVNPRRGCIAAISHHGSRRGGSKQPLQTWISHLDDEQRKYIQQMHYFNRPEAVAAVRTWPEGEQQKFFSTEAKDFDARFFLVCILTPQ